MHGNDVLYRSAIPLPKRWFLKAWHFYHPRFGKCTHACDFLQQDAMHILNPLSKSHLEIEGYR